MMHQHKHDRSLSEVHASVDLSTKGKGWRRAFAFFGPAYLISVGYMDPGNWATDLAGGSKFGYSLIWVLLMSNLMALLLQGFSARLGIVSGRDLAQANRETFPRPINFSLYVLAEIAIAACDLAEVLGMAVGIHLLTGLPLIWGVAITVFDTLLLLFLQRLGMRKMEAFIIGLVAVVSLSFFIEIVFASPSIHEISAGLIPHFENEEALYIAIGIIGATVMPHNLYLHSALVQTRKINRNAAGIKEALKWNRIDSTIALNIAFLVNAAILILAATVFFKAGRTDVAEIKQAYQLLPGFLGNQLSAALFAIALIAAGQSSTVTGTLAGQIVMEGYLRLRINPWIRRLLTRLIAIVPAILVIYWFGEDEVDQLLILSQVILSLQLGFAIIPLIHFVSDKKRMGEFVIKPGVKILAWLIAALLVYLNIKMVINETSGIFHQSGSMLLRALIIALGAGFLFLLGYIIIYPLLGKRRRDSSIQMHREAATPAELHLPSYRRIAVALDFGEHDSLLLAHAMREGRAGTHFILIHVVESASARMLGRESDDYETRQDQDRLAQYVAQLEQQGFSAEGHLGFKDRSSEIIRLVKQEKAEMVIIGAHRHKGIKDWIFGETINPVRHALDIPVLIVNL
ncbi:MAG TPA: Nramp family divalent metal transporter [Chitinophagaceae bacterium]|nr:Nramp family divalent metal transporter [Chitinophagaceae bacterium]